MNSQYILLIITLLIFIVLKSTFKKTKKNPINYYKYSKKDYIMSSAELDLFSTLNDTVGDRYYIFPQVHLSSFLNHNIKGQSFKGALAHIDRKSVDFVLCDRTQIKTLLAIELDDKSHNKQDRKIRDEIVNSILSDANMPLLRIENHGKFDEEEIKRKISAILDS